MRLRVLRPLAALALGAATAFLVACGGDKLIPSGDASSLQSALKQISADYRAGNCDAAQQDVAKAQNALLNLPDSVDPGLRDRLQAGIRNLGNRIPATCEEAQAQTSDTTSTIEPDTTDTETTTTETTTTDTTGTGTTDTDTTPTGTGTTTGTTGTDTGTGGTPPGGGATP